MKQVTQTILNELCNKKGVTFKKYECFRTNYNMDFAFVTTDNGIYELNGVTYNTQILRYSLIKVTKKRYMMFKNKYEVIAKL